MNADLTTARDELTRTVTACETWAELEAAMRGGYCPTLRTSGRKARSRRQRDWDAAVELLAEEVRRAGFRVFDGSRVW